MNPHKVQKWYGNQKYLMSGIGYIFSGKTKFLLLPLDGYLLFSVMNADKYVPKGSKENVPYVTIN